MMSVGNQHRRELPTHVANVDVSRDCGFWSSRSAHISFFLDFSLDQSILIIELFQYGVRSFPLDGFKSYLSELKHMHQ